MVRAEKPFLMKDSEHSKKRSRDSCGASTWHDVGAGHYRGLEMLLSRLLLLLLLLLLLQLLLQLLMPLTHTLSGPAGR
jgi:hypothetical protein